MPHRPASPFAYRGMSRAGRSPSAMLVLHIIQHGENGCKVNPPSCRSIQTTFRRIPDSACRVLSDQRGLSARTDKESPSTGFPHVSRRLGLLSARTDKESPSTVMLNSFPQNRHTVSTAEARSPPLRDFLFPPVKPENNPAFPSINQEIHRMCGEFRRHSHCIPAVKTVSCC